jgi:archaellum component FlaD/FlaE
MAIISDFQEDQDNAKPSPSSARTASFSASLDPSRPVGFLEKVFDFLGEESDFLEQDTAEEEIVAALKVSKEKRRKRKKAEAEEKAAMEVEKKEKEKKEVEKKEKEKEEVEKKEKEKKVVEEEKVEAMEVDKTEEEKSGLRGTDCSFQSLLPCLYFALELFVLCFVWLMRKLRGNAGMKFKSFNFFSDCCFEFLWC